MSDVAWMAYNEVKSGFYNFSKGISEITGSYDLLLGTTTSVDTILGFTIGINKKIPELLNLISKDFDKFAGSLHVSALNLLKPFKVVTTGAKEFLGVLDLANKIKKLSEKNFWDSSKTRVSKQISLFMQIGQKSIESFFIVPDKWNIIQLGKLCSSIGRTAGLTFVSSSLFFYVKDALAFTAAIFSWFSNSIDRINAQDKVWKANIRNTELFKIKSLLEGGVIDDQTKLEIQSRVKSFYTKRKIVKLDSVCNSIKFLTVFGLESRRRRIVSVSEEERSSLKLKKIQKLEKEYDKSCRSYLKKAGELEYYGEKINSEETKKRYLTCAADLKRCDASRKSITNKLSRLKNLKDASELMSKGNQDEILDKLKQTLNTKINKNRVNAINGRQQAFKANIGRWFDVSKIAIIILGTLSAVLLTVTGLATVAAAIGIAAWATSLLVGVLGLVRGYYNNKLKDISYL